MGLRLYLDDCAYSKRLGDLLRAPRNDHYVETPLDSGLLGADDSEHFDYARQHGLIVVTKNPDDFETLHRLNSDHPGVFAIYQDNDSRDMSYEDTARAIQNLVRAGTQVSGQFLVLNAWRY
ncbi:MAG: DUF5615 family PIN-like protein [Chloroflexota bacterium]